MKSLWNSMISTLAFYSILPLPHQELTEENSKYQLCFFPLIGVVIGALLYGWNIAWPYLCNYPLLPAVVFVVVPVVVSRGVHMDGFIDTVDAICSHKPMERKLEILKDKHVGSFSMIILLSYFLIALGVWSEMPIDAIPVLAVGFVLSRALNGLAIVTFPHAETSKNKLFPYIMQPEQKNVTRIVMLVYIAACVVLMIFLQPLYGSIGAAGAFLSYGYYYLMSKRHFGGITENVTGYFVQVCELIIPCVVLVAWKFL